MAPGSSIHHKETFLENLLWLGFNEPFQIYNQSDQEEVYKRASEELSKKNITDNFRDTIDNILLNITHVIRSKDKLAFKEEEILIYKSLNIPVPEFIHIPPLLSQDKKRYKKIEAIPSIFDLKRAGFLPSAILNYLFYSLFSYIKDRKILLPEEMIKISDLSKISKSNSTFSQKLLKYYNKKYIETMKTEELQEKLFELLKSRGIIKDLPGKRKINLIKSFLPELQKRNNGMAKLLSTIYNISSACPLLDEKAKSYIKSNSSSLNNLNKIIYDSNNLRDLYEKRKIFGKLIRTAFTGNPDGIPLKIILKNTSPALIRKKITFLTNGKDSPPLPSYEEIEKRTITYMFKKKFGLEVIKNTKLSGFRNFTWKVNCKENKFLLKRGVEGNLFNFSNEETVLKALEKYGLTPKEPSIDISKEFFPEPLLIYKWVEGRTMKKFSSSFYEPLADYICRVHSYSIPALPLYLKSANTLYEELNALYSFYIQCREENGTKEDKLSLLIYNYIKYIEPEVRKKSSLWTFNIPISVLHRDIRPSNIIVNKDSIIAIDWEEACSGDPAYDICRFFMINNLNLKERKRFLQFYLKLYLEKHPGDNFFSERLKIYELIYFIYFHIKLLLRYIHLKRGSIVSAADWRIYLETEVKNCYKTLASSFNNINHLLKLNKKDYSAEDLEKLGKLL